VTEEAWPYRIQRLARDHSREAFECCAPELTRYFREQIGQDEHARVAVGYVAVTDDGWVAGFYTLSSYTVPANEFPSEITRKLPRYASLPAILIGRLAVDRRHQRRGIGDLLLIDALKRSLAESESVGSWAVFVEAINEKAAGFYRKYDFIALPDQPLRLFLPMRTIEKLG
jgi:GNAT superfamily N-acetyltransferase